MKKTIYASSIHPLISASFIVLGLVGLVLAVFWIRKCSISKKDDQDNNKEDRVIGHERFYQENPFRSSIKKKKKKRVSQRSNSVAEFSTTTLTAAQKRASFHLSRSRSSEGRDGSPNNLSNNNSDSVLRLFFHKRSSSASKHEYSALKTEVSGSSNEKAVKTDNYINNEAFLTCKHYLKNDERYDLLNYLGEIGFRSNKYWFTVQDKILSAERLLTLMPLPTTCPIKPSIETRDILLELFRGFQHPYIHPVLDIQFWDKEAAIISPLCPTGSLKDLIYQGHIWNDNYDTKYNINKGKGLPLKTIQCLGRQILEGLIFLRTRFFPAFYHLHSGNVIIQNGVARLAGLENTILGLVPRHIPPIFDSMAFGYLLFEMASGYELIKPPTISHIELEMNRYPKVAQVLNLIFFNRNTRLPTIEEIIYSDLFRGVELRELRGASILKVWSSSKVIELLELIRNPLPSSPIRRNDTVDTSVTVEAEKNLEDFLVENNEDSDSSSTVIKR